MDDLVVLYCWLCPLKQQSKNWFSSCGFLLNEICSLSSNLFVCFFPPGLLFLNSLWISWLPDFGCQDTVHPRLKCSDTIPAKNKGGEIKQFMRLYIHALSFQCSVQLLFEFPKFRRIRNDQNNFQIIKFRPMIDARFHLQWLSTEVFCGRFHLGQSPEYNVNI